MSLFTTRNRNSVLPSRPVSEPQSLRCLMRDFAGEIQLRPVYQRDIRWKKGNMCDLVKTVMSEGLIPGIIVYRLQAAERPVGSPYRYEMVDGQHRFFTIQKYFQGEPVTETGSKPFMITWVYRDEATNRDIHVFYSKNTHTEEWEAQNRSIQFDYMTEDEKDAFNSFKLDVKEIKDPLTLDQRRAIFVSLQQGVSVRGSDLLKNKVDVPLVRFITEEMNCENQMKNLLETRCWMNPKQYWLHWVIRFFFILNKTNEKNFATRDADISKLILNGSPSLNATDEQMTKLKDAFDRFAFFMESLPVNVKVSPCHFYAIFFFLSDAKEGIEDIIQGHINDWANNSYNKEWKKAWENRKFGDNDDERESYFLEIKEELTHIRVPARQPEERKSIPKRVRLQVWNRDVGETYEFGNCHCCGDEVYFEKNYEAGHIVAHARGGADTAENLRVVCRCCNRSMYTQNMDEFKVQYFA